MEDLSLESQEEFARWAHLVSPDNWDFSQRGLSTAEAPADDSNCKPLLPPQEAEGRLCVSTGMSTAPVHSGLFSLLLGGRWLYPTSGNTGSEVALCGRLAAAWLH